MQPTADPATYRFYHFGLIVTGKGEEEFLPDLFRELMKSGWCSFRVIRRIGQRSPLTSSKKMAKIVGTNKRIPNRDEEEIGIPARRFLTDDSRFVLIIDDLEHDRRDQASQVFLRYREALDSLLGNRKHKASVHFLVNMLEAYYFADPNAVNSVLGTRLQRYNGDVETIRHPKNELKKIKPGFDEVKDGREILRRINTVTVLSDPSTCAWLRSLFAWCIAAMQQTPSSKFNLDKGIYSIITGRQIGSLS